MFHVCSTFTKGWKLPRTTPFVPYQALFEPAQEQKNNIGHKRIRCLVAVFLPGRMIFAVEVFVELTTLPIMMDTPTAFTSS